MQNEGFKQSRDLALPLIGVGNKIIRCTGGDKAEALLLDGDDDSLEVGGQMLAAPNSCRYSWLTTVMIALRQKVEDSRTENSWDILFVAVAVCLWNGKRYKRFTLLTC